MRRLAWLALLALAAARAAVGGVRGQELHGLAGVRHRDARARRRGARARGPDVLLRRASSPAPTATSRSLRTSRCATSTSARAAREYTPGGDTALGTSDAAGRFGFVRMPQGLRIVWHYVQDGGVRTFILRYRLRGVVIAHDDAVEVAPQVWGNQWKDGLPLLFANVQAPGGVRAARTPGSSPRGSSHRVTVRGEPRADGGRRRAEQARGDPARALPALGARRRTRPTPSTCTTTSLPATIAREQAAAAAQRATSASSRTRSTTR